jgi:hypothetical protein
MGCTMMPLFTGALRTLSGPTIARGSTLMNITQQIASSVGTATMSVILTNQIRDSKFAAAAIGSWADPSIKDKVPAGAIAKGLSDAGHGFAVTFTVALVLIVITLIPVLLLPGRRPASSETGAGEAAAEVPVALH